MSSSCSSTSSTCSCQISSSSPSRIEYKEYHFLPESNADIKSKIASFWKHLEQANICVPDSNVNKFDISSDKYVKEFEVRGQNEKSINVKSFDNKWCQLLQLMSRRGLDKLAMQSKPKPCRFCEYESFQPTYADENCGDMVLEIEKSIEEKMNMAGFDDVAEKLKNIEEYLKQLMYSDKTKEIEASEEVTRIRSDKIETRNENAGKETSEMNKDKMKNAMNDDEMEETNTMKEEIEENVILNRKDLEEKSNINTDQMKEILNIHDIAEYVRLSHADINQNSPIQEELLGNIDKETTMQIMMKILSQNTNKKKKKRK